MGRVDPRTIGFRLDVPPDQHDFPADLRRAVAEGRVAQLPQRWRPPLRQYEELRAALAVYRSLAVNPSTTIPSATARAVRPGEPSWRVRQIELALERLRWLPHLDDERLIALNIPMFRLWVWDRGVPRATPRLGMDVIVGRAMHTQTPVFVEDMRAVIIRPYWNVPRSILRNEILPRLERDPDYLRREQMELVRGNGDDAATVAWSSEALRELRSGALRVRQRPGPRNALGLIKFVFPNVENVDMHGTPTHCRRHLRSRSQAAPRPDGTAVNASCGRPVMGWLVGTLIGESLISDPLRPDGDAAADPAPCTHEAYRANELACLGALLSWRDRRHDGGRG